MNIRKPVLVVMALGALAVLFGGCSGDLAQTLPSPDGVPAGSNARFGLQDDGTDITGAVRSQFTVEERLTGTTDAYQTARVIDLREFGGQEVNQANVVLNLDRSGSMSGQKIIDLKVAAKLFVSLMRANDQTESMSFASSWTTDQAFTSDQSLLNAAIDGISAGGGTNAWDSGKAGLESLALLSAAGLKALVIMSDGSSSGDLQGMIDRANELAIPIFTIAFQLGSETARNAMQRAANETGGQAYEPATQQELQDAFFAVSQSIHGAYQIFWASNFDPGTHVDIRITYNGPGGPVVVERTNVIVVAPDP